MENINKKFASIILILFLIFLTSCSEKPYTLKTTFFKQPHPRAYKVAVLPFDNLSSNEEAGEIATEIFSSMLIDNKTFVQADRGAVKKAIMEKRIRASRDIDLSTLKWLGETLDVDMVFTGTVLDFQYFDDGGRSVPVVAITIRMLNPELGRTEWVSYHVRKGNDRETFFGWGRIDSLPELTGIVIQEIINSF
jgi:hypothetical protein